MDTIAAHDSNAPNTRVSGILLHPTSLPGPCGVGSFGSEAYYFVDFLAAAKQALWQVLPLGPTGYGDSPYQCFSTFAGNPQLVSLELLMKQGWVDKDDLSQAPHFDATRVDYGALYHFKRPLLAVAAQRFLADADPPARDEFASFCRTQPWLDDYALFMALKDEHQGQAWTSWEPALIHREKAALQAAFERLGPAIEVQRAIQYFFHCQWRDLHDYARQKGITIVGDMPIYVACDSADVWANQELFQLADDGQPTAVAGVPPDYFSATGQLWGNPLYAWQRHQETGFAWWIQRIEAALQLYDMVRIDHFRGFAAYWSVPWPAETAVDGEWLPAPGRELFAALSAKLGSTPLIAENLGVITEDVECLRRDFGLPGMAILQFAFGSDEQAASFRPHNYERHLVAYTGTHDNDTTVGWYHGSGTGDSTRQAEEIDRERAHAREYLHSDGSEIHWDFIRTLMASVAQTVIFPMQDVLGLSSQARFNVPAKAAGNWCWRLTSDQLDDELAARLARMSELYERTPGN